MEGNSTSDDGDGPSKRTFTNPGCHDDTENNDQALLSEISIPPSAISGLSVHQVRPGGDAPDNLSSPTTIEMLPNELLSNIFGFLDSPKPSTSALRDEPHFTLTQTGDVDLKAISVVSKRWRRLILPLLFRHARFIAAKSEGPNPLLQQEIQPFLDFAAQDSLQHVIKSLTLVIEDNRIAHNPDEIDRLNGFGTFWEALFATIDLADLVIAAPVDALGALTSCHVFMEDAWTFDCPYHYLRLQRGESPISNDFTLAASVTLPGEDVNISANQEIEAPAINENFTSSSTRSETSPLFEIRPWSSLLLNEGSFIKAYATYEFWLRQAPSILPDLVGAEDEEQNPHRARISSTIRQMSYIGIFPMASHFSALTMHFPRLDGLYVQLVPRSDILDKPEKLIQVEMADLWMERNSCYAILMRELFNAPPVLNYKYLQVFESGDAADRDAWNMAVEYVKRVGNGWRTAADGVFERDPEDLAPEPAEGDEADLSTPYEGALIRWAWNGITKLPVSAYPLYDQPMGPLS